MAGNTEKHFGKRRPPPTEPTPPAKRSRHVALLVMGTLAVGGGAYAMMPRENCEPNNPAIASGQNGSCTSRQSSSSSGAHGYYGGSSSRGSDSPSRPSSSGGGSGDSGVSHTTRGGFGSFGHAVAASFSRGS